MDTKANVGDINDLDQCPIILGVGAYRIGWVGPDANYAAGVGHPFCLLFADELRAHYTG